VDRRAFLIGFFGGAALWPTRSFAQADIAGPSELSYRSGSLNIQAHFYQPPGSGKFPLIIYNHGSRPKEREPRPFPYIGKMFAQAGFAVLVPERRGYGKSDGRTYSQEVGGNLGAAAVTRLQAETDDVLAALAHAKTVDTVDPGRIGIAGWSLGGIITMFAVARSPAFRAALNQAGGALMWPRSPAVQDALRDAGRAAQAPVMLMVAENDRTTNSITEVAAAMRTANRPHEVKIYPPFRPREASLPLAPGHAIFGADGVSIWRNDAVGFFNRRLRA
jgi:dienelactone hydrolase